MVWKKVSFVIVLVMLVVLVMVSADVPTDLPGGGIDIQPAGGGIDVGVALSKGQTCDPTKDLCNPGLSCIKTKCTKDANQDGIDDDVLLDYQDDCGGKIPNECGASLTCNTDFDSPYCTRNIDVDDDGIKGDADHCPKYFPKAVPVTEGGTTKYVIDNLQYNGCMVGDVASIANGRIVPKGDGKVDDSDLHWLNANYKKIDINNNGKQDEKDKSLLEKYFKKNSFVIIPFIPLIPIDAGI